MTKVLTSRRPMSQISSIFGTDDDNEILEALYLVANVSVDTDGHRATAC